MDMSKTQATYIATLLVIVTVIFTAVEICVWTGVIPPANEAEGFFANLLYGLEKAIENPALWGWIMTVLVGLGGYLENWVRTGEEFDARQFAETFFFYEPVLIGIAQLLPLEYAIVLTFVIDVLRRIALRIKPTPATVPQEPIAAG